MINKKKENGFTLIEMVVVSGSLAIIVVAMISTVLLTFKSQNKAKADSKISENGRAILVELRRNIFNGSPKTIICGAGGSSVSIMDLNIGSTSTTLVCRNSNIASNSAVLNSSEVTAFNCQNFVVCTKKVGSSDVSVVTFNFGLRSTVAGVGSSQLYNTVVTTRN